MSVTITGTPELTTIVAPSNTELGDAATLVSGVVQPVANRLAYDREQIDDLRARTVGALQTPRFFDPTRGRTWSNHWEVRQFSQTAVPTLQHMVLGAEPWVIRLTDWLPISGRIRSFGVQYVSTQSTPPDYAAGVPLRIGLGADTNLAFGVNPTTLEYFVDYSDPEDNRGRHQVANVLSTPHEIDPLKEYVFFIWGESGAYATTGGTIERAYLVID